MADVSYIPTFHHTNWVDKLDRVEADGPNGFNTRFNAIGADLRQLSTVVGQVSAAINQLDEPPAPRPQQLTLSPVLHTVSPNLGWTIDDNGAARVTLGLGGGTALGVMNLTMPDQVRLTSLRVRGSRDDVADEGTVALFRTPLRVVLGAPPLEQVATVDLTPTGGFDRQSLAVSSAAVIDTSTFRYVVRARLVSGGGVFTSATITTFQLNFVPV